MVAGTGQCMGHVMRKREIFSPEKESLQSVAVIKR